ncbi:MAG: nitrilase [Bacteroidetes bacterium GWF2_41_61]|nr:MAG: nitrilase [Bacteroidetes bacterium GWE2_40_15]OFY34695.1 MAG: nitrilase [Bacteroidetes bacterium GWF2_41_61]HBG23557.1 nitrilase [Rikenellaceae bacterium]HBZ25902.1 nitrilase [Rikenellaceae bacterium]
MENIRISTAQFESRSADKGYNLAIMERLSAEAAAAGSNVIAFHECSLTGYTFARNLSKKELLDIAEFIPDGESMKNLTEIASEYNIAILAGLFEKDKNGDIYKAYVCVTSDGVVAKHRKLHPFINPHLTAGNSYTVFDLFGWRCGILICYDNNILENVRATKLLGADIIFMPHVTMCTPSKRPGSGFVDPKLWINREVDPTSLRQEFDGPKGREWLMRWLPSRAHDNGIYVVFSNPIGMDDDQLKNGCSMIIDPYGDIVAECRKLGNDFETALITPGKLISAGGSRYTNARRPNLYGDIISKSHNPVQKIAWMDD